VSELKLGLQIFAPLTASYANLGYHLWLYTNSANKALQWSTLMIKSNFLLEKVL